MIIYLLLRDNKAYNILKKVQKKLFVARKTIFCWKKKNSLVLHKKSSFVTKRSWCCTKKCLSQQKKLMLHKNVFDFDKNKLIVNNA